MKRHIRGSKSRFILGGQNSYVRKYSLSDAMSRMNIPGSLTEQEFRELLEFRCVMEGPLCELAVSRMKDALSDKKGMDLCLLVPVQIRYREGTFRAFDDAALADRLFDIGHERRSDGVDIHTAVYLLLQQRGACLHLQLPGPDRLHHQPLRCAPAGRSI